MITKRRSHGSGNALLNIGHRKCYRPTNNITEILLETLIISLLLKVIILAYRITFVTDYVQYMLFSP